MNENEDFCENEQNFDFLKKVPSENGSIMGFLGGQKLNKTGILSSNKFDNIIFSHYPIQVEDNILNIHGHIHNVPLSKEFNPRNHICISVEVIDYTPQTLQQIFDKAENL